MLYFNGDIDEFEDEEPKIDKSKSIHTQNKIKKILGLKHIELRCQWHTDNLMYISLYGDGKFLIGAEIAGYPANCGTVLLSNVRCFYSRQGVGKLFLAGLIKFLQDEDECGYTNIQMVIPDNGEYLSMMHLAEFFKFKIIDSFVNRRSGNKLNVYSLSLAEE